MQHIPFGRRKLLLKSLYNLFYSHNQNGFLTTENMPHMLPIYFRFCVSNPFHAAWKYILLFRNISPIWIWSIHINNIKCMRKANDLGGKKVIVIVLETLMPIPQNK